MSIIHNAGMSVWVSKCMLTSQQCALGACWQSSSLVTAVHRIIGTGGGGRGTGSAAMWSYPSLLQHLGPLHALVDEDGLLGLVVGRQLHLGVDGVQVPLEAVALHPLPQRHALANVAVVTVTQLGTQGEVLLLSDTRQTAVSEFFRPHVWVGSVRI